MKMTVAEFTYDKQDRTRPTDRKILVLSKPSDSYLGIEFDNLEDIANVLDYLAEKETMDQYLKAKYEVGPDTNYKRFKEAKMTCLTEEKITI